MLSSISSSSPSTWFSQLLPSSSLRTWLSLPAFEQQTKRSAVASTGGSSANHCSSAWSRVCSSKLALFQPGQSCMPLESSIRPEDGFAVLQISNLLTDNG